MGAVGLLFATLLGDCSVKVVGQAEIGSAEKTSCSQNKTDSIDLPILTTLNVTTFVGLITPWKPSSG